MPAKLTGLIQNYFGFEMPQEETIFDIDSPVFQEVLEELTKYEHFKPRGKKNINENSYKVIDFMRPTNGTTQIKESDLKGATSSPNGASAGNFNPGKEGNYTIF